MARHAQGAERRGAALLLVIVTTSLTMMLVMTLWHTTARARRALRMERAIATADALVDSVMLEALHHLDSVATSRPAMPGDTLTLRRVAAGAGAAEAGVARVGWQTLLVRTQSVVAGGMRGVRARGERRMLIPLRTPFTMPDAALTGANGWIVPVGALVDVPIAAGIEGRCRDPGIAAPERRSPFSADSFPARHFVALDPDTVSGAFVGAFRLTRDRLMRPLEVTGIVALDSELTLEADLRVTGVLIARGSVRSAAGRLDVTGAVVAGDAGGGQSRLGPLDRVRYDACAIRQALVPVTDLASAVRWTPLHPF
jgi:hypothetical protein